LEAREKNELIAFVRKALAHGQSRTDIEGALSGAGWQKDDIQAALARFSDIPG
jgi:hypothetical protein